MSALYYGAAAYAQFVGRNYDKAIKLAREAIHLRGDFVGGHRVLTASAGMAGQASSPPRRCRSCAGRSPTSASPGSRPRCRSSTTPTGSTISRVPPRRPGVACPAAFAILRHGREGAGDGISAARKNRPHGQRRRAGLRRQQPLGPGPRRQLRRLRGGRAHGRRSRRQFPRHRRGLWDRGDRRRRRPVLRPGQAGDLDQGDIQGGRHRPRR